MKLKNILGRLAVFAVILAVILTSLCAVFAVGEDDEEGEMEVVTDAVITEAPVETEAPKVETEAPVYTEEPKVETEASTEEESKIENIETEPATDAQPQTERETKYEEIFLPEAVTEEDPTAVVVKPTETKDLTYGYASWACVIVGVLTIIIVIISNKSNYTGGAGKHRYGEGNKITGAKQRLLNDDYYTNRKYNSYYDKDIRR